MMTPRQQLTRRRFLGATAATAGGILMAGARWLGAKPTVTPSEFPSTDHFWYRPQPEGPYIDSQRDNKAFGFRERKVFLSDDGAKTWAYSAEFADAEDIMFSSILGNGNIVFATRTRIYLSTDNLKTYRELVVKDRNGRAYRPHTPIDPKSPGSYFYSIDGIHTCDVGGMEMLIWGNYCNVRHGATPSNIYYSRDHGETVERFRDRVQRDGLRLYIRLNSARTAQQSVKRIQRNGYERRSTSGQAEAQRPPCGGRDRDA